METTDIKILLTNNKSNQEKGFALLKGHLSAPLKSAPLDTRVELKIVDSFKSGKLAVSKVDCSNLANVELMWGDKNDPYVLLQLGNTKLQTKFQDNAGATAVFDNLDFVFDVTKEMLTDSELIVEVWDKNKLNKDVLIGQNKFQLSFLLSNIGEDLEKSVDLMNKSKMNGIAIISLKLIDDETLKKPTFDSGVLLISSIKGVGLKNTELFSLFGDKADPFIQLSIGTWSVQTKPLVNAGSTVIWDHLDFRCDISGKQMISDEIDIKVFDKNNYTRNAFIGQGKKSLREIACSPIGQEIDLVLTLFDKKQKDTTGQLVIRMEVREKGKAPNSALPTTFKTGILHIFRISTFDLSNLEVFGKQDPYVKVKLGSFEGKTPVIDNGGGTVVFDWLDMKSSVSVSSLQEESIYLEAWESNNTGDLLIGKGSCKIDTVCQIGEEVQLLVNLLSNKGDPAGRLSVFVKLIEDNSDSAIAKDFDKGTVSIQRVCVFGVQNKEMFSILGAKQSLFTKIKFKDWSGKTPIQSSAGTDCIWENIDMDFDVSRSDLESGIFEVDVCSKTEFGIINSVGVGSVQINRAASKLDQLIDLSINLKDAKGKELGRAVLYVKVSKFEVENLTIPNSFEIGTFNISKISAFNLKNTELIGKQDPYVTLKFGDWTDKTHTIDEAGDNASWDFLSIDCENVTKQILRTQQLEVSVFDENTTRSDVLIGKSSIPLLVCASKLGTVQKLTLKIMDEQDKFSGKVVIYGTLSPFEKVADLPPSYQEGILKIKRITAINLKNKEFLGKGDPYVKLELNEFKTETNVQKGAGENVTWNYLDYQIRCDRRSVNGSDITVEVWDKETFNDKLIGKASIPIKKAGSKLGHEIELEKVKLKSAKNEDVGTVILLVELNEVAPLVQPKLELPADFKIGTIVITEIKAIALPNRELIGKQVCNCHYHKLNIYFIRILMYV